jgi:hypothetical protein
MPVSQQPLRFLEGAAQERLSGAETRWQTTAGGAVAAPRHGVSYSPIVASAGAHVAQLEQGVDAPAEARDGAQRVSGFVRQANDLVGQRQAVAHAVGLPELVVARVQRVGQRAAIAALARGFDRLVREIDNAAAPAARGTRVRPIAP